MIVEFCGPAAVDGRQCSVHPDVLSIRVPYSTDGSFWEFDIDREPYTISVDGDFIHRAHMRSDNTRSNK